MDFKVRGWSSNPGECKKIKKLEWGSSMDRVRGVNRVRVRVRDRVGGECVILF